MNELVLTNKYKLSNSYTVWFHKSKDSNWGVSSYKKVKHFDNVKDFWMFYLYSSKFTNGMFYLMKKDIVPMWEDKNNIKGRCYSYKISKEKTAELWETLSCLLIGDTLAEEDSQCKSCHINGISLTFRKLNSIIKIWTCNKNDLKINNKIIDTLGDALIQNNDERD